jgi:hypothetical protein
MKKIFFAVLISVTVNAFGTNWMTFHTYHEIEYLQGPWLRTNILENSDYRYLYPEIHEELLGSDNEMFGRTLLKYLKEKKPKVYPGEFQVQIKNDTVVIALIDSSENFELIKNEIVATFTLNGFNAVNLTFKNTSKHYTLQDVSVPYFDIHAKGQKEVLSESEEPLLVEEKSMENDPELTSEPNNSTENSFSPLLILSFIFNVVLIGVIVAIRKRKKY